jgi:putative hydrolase of HD superfamily
MGRSEGAASPTEALLLVHFFDRLASLPRTGWLLRGVVDPESIAEHCFGVCVVATLLIDDLRARGVTLDGERVLRMAIVHDAAEAFTGDIPMPAKTDALRAALESAEASLLAQVLPARELALWTEAERGTSIEARVVKAADKIQMLAKALTYEKQRRGRLDEFWQNAANRNHMGLDFARDLFDELTHLAALERASESG